MELPKTVRRPTASSVCPRPPHPEERACGSAAANQVVRARVSKDGAAIPLMLRDASQRIWAMEAPALAFGCDAPQHEGDGARRILASQAAARARKTNLRV